MRAHMYICKRRCHSGLNIPCGARRRPVQRHSQDGVRPRVCAGLASVHSVTVCPLSPPPPPPRTPPLFAFLLVAMQLSPPRLTQRGPPSIRLYSSYSYSSSYHSLNQQIANNDRIAPALSHTGNEHGFLALPMRSRFPSASARSLKQKVIHPLRPVIREGYGHDTCTLNHPNDTFLPFVSGESGCPSPAVSHASCTADVTCAFFASLFLEMHLS